MSIHETKAEPEVSTHDVEANTVDDDLHLTNTTVQRLEWQGIIVTVDGRGNNGEKKLISDIDGCANAGELFALMGPSGCGKTTLLNVLAHRTAASKATIEGTVTVNGAVPSLSAFQQASCYVEQEDALIGSLTVRETLNFAARLALPRSVSSRDRKRRVDALLASFGLQKQANSLIGTPIRKGISGGQKRRTGVAAQLITGPKMLFLDEPTSGLDAVASYEVMSYLKDVAKRHKLIIIASIHQPSTTTFALFDKLLLMSGGKTCYNGPIDNIESYFGGIGFPMPTHINPAEFLLAFTNVDFAAEVAKIQLDKIQSSWASSEQAKSIQTGVSSPRKDEELYGLSVQDISGTTKALIPITLVHRSFIKSYRDVVAYGIRFAMYFGLAIMSGTVWLRLPTTQEAIQPFINSIFFGSAFMSFMAVAYVPSFLEDRSTFVKERANGLYGAFSFTLSNFLIGIPYLFLIVLLYSITAYFLSNFQPTASAFFTWIMWLFLDLLAAESLVVLLSSLFPVFVIALALTAFANGLWMCVSGFLVTPKILNVFYRYVFSYIDYQAYVFRGMMVNEFAHRTYSCAPIPPSSSSSMTTTAGASSCSCMYDTPLASQCRIAGTGVLDAYGFEQGKTGKWVGIMLAITLAYRVLGWVALWLRKT